MTDICLTIMSWSQVKMKLRQRRATTYFRLDFNNWPDNSSKDLNVWLKGTYILNWMTCIKSLQHKILKWVHYIWSNCLLWTMYLWQCVCFVLFSQCTLVGFALCFHQKRKDVFLFIFPKSSKWLKAMLHRHTTIQKFIFMWLLIN